MERLFTAIPTPFIGGKIDYISLEKLINFQISNKVEAIVLSGSTGEGHSLSANEWCELLQFAVKFQDKISVVAGIGFNITEKAVDYAKMAEKIKVDYILATTPYYNKPQQRGIYEHFKCICNAAANTKIILYNVPSRTATDLQNETIEKLARDFTQIVAVKDATGILDRVCDLKNRFSDLKRSFVMLSGEDTTQIGFNAMGGKGIISVVSNIKPDLCRKIQDACKDNNYELALQYQNDLFKFSNAMFCETNPVPVKYALYKLNIFTSPECRLPLMELSDEHKKNIDNLLEQFC